MKVSCILVTGHKPERYPLAQVAIQQYHAQTHQDKELIIINEGEPLNAGIEIPVEPGHSLGALRNLGLCYASGNLVIQWDDDDYSSPTRIETQVKAYQTLSIPNAAIILQREILLDLTTGDACVIDAGKWAYKGFPGTILHGKNLAAQYPDWKKSEDEIFLQKFAYSSIENDPQLYIRTWHGYNTWDRGHYQMLRKNSRPLNMEEILTAATAHRQYTDAGFQA